MTLKNFLFLLVIIVSNTLYGQQSINDYKYVIIPTQFDFQKTEDQYQLNSLAKFLFKKEGFKVLLSNEIRSEELASNPCLALTSRVKDVKGFLTTKLVIELVNCRNETIHTSIIGKSKEKEYKKSFQKALRNAFESITALHYSYNGSNNTTAITGKETQKETPEKDIPMPVNVDEISEEKEISVVVETPVDIPAKVNAPEVSAITKNDEVVKIKEVVSTPKNLLYAQANALGFQLVDSTPKVVYVLLKSSREDVFFLKNKKGILYKKNGSWIAEYYQGEKLIQKRMAIKF